jgi:hypothetical protein
MTSSLHRELKTISIPMQIDDRASAQRSKVLTASLHRELNSISIHMQIDDCASAQRAEEPLYSHAEC